MKVNIQIVLELHKQWLRDEGGRRARLRGADLQEAELEGAL